MKQIITIIIPIYNGEKYLARCLDSVVDQTIGIDRLQLVLINDGSRDGSLKIAEKYAKQFPESIKVYSQKNSGTARTRNRGIKLSKTKYTMFIDQDDFIDPDYCQRFFEAAEKTNAEVVAGGFRRTNGEKVFYTRPANTHRWYPYVHAEAWAKIHRTDFIKGCGAQFFSNIFGEDIPFTFQETLAIQRFEVIDYVGYNWFTNEASITQTVHRDFAKLGLAKLLKKLGQLSQNELSQYYILIVALYAFMVSDIQVSRRDFRRNLKTVFQEIQKVVPDIAENPYLKKPIDGIPPKTFLAARIFVSFYRRGWFNLLYIINRLSRQKVTSK